MNPNAAYTYLISADPMLFVRTISAEGSLSQVYPTSDGGTSWSLLLNQALITPPVAVGSGNSIFASEGTGQFRSENKGLTWIRIENIPSGASIHSLSVSEGILYAGTSGTGIWKRPLMELLP